MIARKRNSELPWVLGISASHHNAGVCILHGEQVCVAIQEERLSGYKRAGFSAADPTLSVPYALNAAGITASDLDMVVLCTAGYSASDVRNDLTLNSQLRVIANGTPYKVIPHHLGHAIGVYALSGFSEAAILVADGLGSPYSDLADDERLSVVEPHPDGWEHLSLYHARDKSIRCLEKHLTDDQHWLRSTGPGMPLFSSFGGMYSAVAQQIFGNPLEAGKVMGLAPYGVSRFGPSDFFIGSQQAFSFKDIVPKHFPYSDRWPSRKQEYEDLAASVQEALQEAILNLADRLKRLTGARFLCYAGGIALNCTTNEMLYRAASFSDIFILPAAEDSGVAIGAAYYGLWNLIDTPIHPPRLISDGFGSPYSELDLRRAIEPHSGIFSAQQQSDATDLCGETATRLARGEICAWFDGPSELGPRALGQRSILADPRALATKTHINDHIKKRESFRPLAPVVLEEYVSDWFDIPSGTSSPFMLRNWMVLTDKAPLIPAVIHVDQTARVQTVNRTVNPRMYALLEAFERITKVPILLNTSFNGPGEPIVETPEDALWSFLGMEIDFLVLGNFLITLDRAWSSLLDLVPYVVVDSASCSLKVAGGRLATTPTLHSLLTLNVSTPWGNKRQSISGRGARILHQIDGESTGWQLVQHLVSMDPQWDRRIVAGELCALRRNHILSFRMPEPTKMPAPREREMPTAV
jgi:carbamoyltransferase